MLLVKLGIAQTKHEMKLEVNRNIDENFDGVGRTSTAK